MFRPLAFRFCRQESESDNLFTKITIPISSKNLNRFARKKRAFDFAMAIVNSKFAHDRYYFLHNGRKLACPRGKCHFSYSHGSITRPKILATKNHSVCDAACHRRPQKTRKFIAQKSSGKKSTTHLLFVRRLPMYPDICDRNVADQDAKIKVAKKKDFYIFEHYSRFRYCFYCYSRISIHVGRKGSRYHNVRQKMRCQNIPRVYTTSRPRTYENEPRTRSCIKAEIYPFFHVAQKYLGGFFEHTAQQFAQSPRTQNGLERDPRFGTMGL